MNLQTNFAEEIDTAARRDPVRKVTTYIRRHRWFMLLVALPVALAVIYYALIASDQYVSEARFIVKSPNQRGGQVSSIASLIQTTGLSRGQEETNTVLDYIRSRNALSDLEKRMDVRGVFADPDADRLSRYPFPLYDAAKFENLYDYYVGKVETHLDNETGLAVLNVRAFDPAQAQRLNARLLDLSEDLVNRLNERAHAKQIEEAQNRVREAEVRVRAARVVVGRFRNSQNLIDPQAQAGGIYGVVMQLTGQRAPGNRFETHGVHRHEGITELNRLNHGHQARKKHMGRCDTREPQHDPDPQQRKKPGRIDVRRLLAEELKNLWREQKAGRDGEYQQHAHDDVDAAQDPQKQSRNFKRPALGLDHLTLPQFIARRYQIYCFKAIVLLLNDVELTTTLSYGSAMTVPSPARSKRSLNRSRNTANSSSLVQCPGATRSIFRVLKSASAVR